MAAKRESECCFEQRTEAWLRCRVSFITGTDAHVFTTVDGEADPKAVEKLMAKKWPTFLAVLKGETVKGINSDDLMRGRDFEAEGIRAFVEEMNRLGKEKGLTYRVILISGLVHKYLLYVSCSPDAIVEEVRNGEVVRTFLLEIKTHKGEVKEEHAPVPAATKRQIQHMLAVAYSRGYDIPCYLCEYYMDYKQVRIKQYTRDATYWEKAEATIRQFAEVWVHSMPTRVQGYYRSLNQGLSYEKAQKLVRNVFFASRSLDAASKAKKYTRSGRSSCCFSNLSFMFSRPYSLHVVFVL
jgi:hypothetical protein